MRRLRLAIRSLAERVAAAAPALHAGGSIDLVVVPDIHQEAHRAIPPEQDPQAMVDRERPVGREIAFQPVRTKQRVPGVGGEPSKRRPQELAQLGRELP
jgi:hypothetical protein